MSHNKMAAAQKKKLEVYDAHVNPYYAKIKAPSQEQQ